MRIFLFTPEDNPVFKDQNTKDQSIKHARQLKDMDVQIELFPLFKKEGHHFEINKFYSEIITIDLDEINNAVLDASSKIMDLQQRVKQKEYRKRALNRLLLEVGDDLQIGLKVFCLVNKAKKPYGKPVEKKTNSLLKKKA
jgi:ATP-dependent DNA helicase 2 subunit 1